MPWCPKCRNEYVKGIKVCADCGVALVETLEEENRSPLIFGDKGQMERLRDFLVYNQLKTVDISEDSEEGVYELSVNEEERQRALMAVKVFLQQEAQAAETEEEGEYPAQGPKDTGDGIPEQETGGEAGVTGGEEKAGGREGRPAYQSVYQNSAQRAEENRSSGYLLIVVGGIGLVAVFLIFGGIIQLPAAMANKFMVCGVMGALFLLFFVMGILSMKSSKELERKAESESSLVHEIKRWCGENMSAQDVDEGLFMGEEPEEIKYFKRTDKMKGMIARQFLNLEEGFLDSFVDDYYQVVFGQKAEEGLQ